MAKETTPTSDTDSVANVDDAIADLLTGGETSEEVEEETTNDSDDQEEVSDESTDVEESDEEQEELEEDEDETTWSSVLGVDDSNVVLDDNGDFAGVNVKVDGATSTVGVKDLIAGFQTNKHNTNTSKQLADDRREFEGIRDNAVETYTKKLNDIAKLSEYMHSNLVSEYENINWQQLRAENPAEYAAAMQDFNKRQQDIQQVYSAIESEREFESGNTNKSSAEALQKHNMQELTKVRANNPEWDTDEKLTEAFGTIGKFVNETYGITQQEFNSVASASHIEIMKDAMAYRKGKSATQKKIKNKVLPKYQKSKGTVRKKVSKLDKLTKAAKSASGATKRNLEIDAIAELIGG